MRRSEWLVRAALVFCLLYGIVAVADRTHEAFPFFAWDLFATVPNPHGTDFSVRIVAADGYPGTLPVFYEDSQLHPTQEIQAYAAMQQLGESIAAGDTARAAALRTTFETTYLSGLPHVRYQVVKRTYDVRARAACRECFTGETVIARYERG